MRATVLGAVLLVLSVSAGWGSSAKVNGGRFGSVISVSCGAPGECAAGGYYNDGPDPDSQAFVVSETNGSWGNPIEVPGTARLNTGDHAAVQSVSCAAPGECAAGGSYAAGHTDAHAFVVSETKGRWGEAIEVPGTATPKTGGGAVNSVSCPAARECVAGGYYATRGGVRAFVVSETNGHWGKAVEVPGMAKLNTGDQAEVDSVSCAAPRDCVAGGWYDKRAPRWPGSSPIIEAFVVSETNGHWGKAIEVPGTAALNTLRFAEVKTVSCGAPADCAAGGFYTARPDQERAFVVSETNGHWGNAIKVRGSGTPNTDDQAAVDSVSCAAAGDCVAGGWSDQGAGTQAVVANETNGSWGDAIEVPGTATLGIAGKVQSISCAATGECSAIGFYLTPSGSAYRLHVFAASETNSSWGSATEAQGTPKPDGDTVNASISCAATGECAAGGSVGGLLQRAFVVNQTNGSWGNAIRLHNFPASCVVPKLVGKRLRAAKQRLDTVHCRAGKITYTSSTLKKGLVVAQHPKPGRHLKGGSAVALTVSDGTRPTASGVPARIIFPVIGRVRYSDDFGDPRPGGTHQGNDILARRKAPVLAVEGGKIRFWTSSASAGCMLYLHGRSGTMYEYIHLNNDRTNKNDNRGHCVDGVAYAPGLKDGAHVQAGELIGYVGDSGDANGLHPHLHFELHPHGGAAVSPYRWLRRARHLTAPTSRP